MLLSIAMMVKNEERYLEKCLESLQPIMDMIDSELIIVDTGSTDDTVEIARRFTDKVYFYEWKNNFSEVRNITINYSSGQWILIIDGDEVINNSEGIIQFFKSFEYRQYNTACVSVKNFTSTHNEKDFSVLLSPRLFRKDKDFGFKGAVHNQPNFKEPVLVLNSDILHYGYINSDKELMERKFQRTATILKNELENNPENIYYLYQLSVSYSMHQDFEDALEPIVMAYNLVKGKKLDLDRYLYVYSQLAKTYLRNGMFREVEQSCIEIIKENSIYIDLYFYLAKAQVLMNKNKEAIYNYNIYLEKLLSDDIAKISQNISVNFDTLGKYEEVYLDLSTLYEKTGEIETALEFAKKIKSSDMIIPAFERIIALYIKLKKYNELRNYYNSEILINQIELNDNFLKCLEGQLLRTNKEIRKKIHETFSEGNTEYSLLNRLRISSEDQREDFAEKINNFDFNRLPDYYGDLVYYFICKKVPLKISFNKVYDFKMRAYLNFLASKYEDLGIVIYEYFKSVEIKEWALDEIRLNKILFTYVFKSNSLNDTQYQEMFDDYIKYGHYYLEQVYNNHIIENEIVYRMKDEEDSFLMYMYLAKKNSEDKVQYLKCLRNALNTCAYMKRGIEMLLEEEKKSFAKGDNLMDKDVEMELYKKKVKESINKFINSNNLANAKALIDKYESIVKEDMDIYSMKAIITIMEGEYLVAENILKTGLEREPFNQDLLFNMSYLMDITNKDKKALEYFSNAKLFNSNSNVKVSDIICNLKPIDNNNLKVIHGTIEIANQMHTMTEGMRKLGIDAKNLNYYPSYLRYASDYTLDINSFNNGNELNLATKKLASKIISENDVFHFHFGTSLTLDYSDLSLLKELGKKVIMQYWGSDVRMYSKAVNLNPYVKVKNTNEDDIKRTLEMISKYVPNCLVDYELAEYVKEYHSGIHYTRVAMDLSKYKFIKETYNDKLLIVHAPTSPEIKGSSYILKAIEELKEKYDFDFKLVQGMSHDEATKIYEQADLIIDQILGGGYGVFAVESMAMGKPVICWISDFMKEKYPKELPIIVANPDNIKQKIEYAINNKDMLKEIGIRGRIYAEKYHDMNQISKNIIEIYKKI